MSTSIKLYFCVFVNIYRRFCSFDFFDIFLQYILLCSVKFCDYFIDYFNILCYYYLYSVIIHCNKKGGIIMEFYAISANNSLHRYFKGLVLTFSDIMEWYLRLEEIDNGEVVSSFDFFVDTKDELLYIIEKVYPQYMGYPLLWICIYTMDTKICQFLESVFPILLNHLPRLMTMIVMRSPHLIVLTSPVMVCHS